MDRNHLFLRNGLPIAIALGLAMAVTGRATGQNDASPARTEKLFALYLDMKLKEIALAFTTLSTRSIR